MAQPRSDQLITALDIGSWKVSALIAERLPSGDIQVLGTGQRESRGVKRGYIADMDATESAVRDEPILKMSGSAFRRAALSAISLLSKSNSAAIGSSRKTLTNCSPPDATHLTPMAA